METWIKSILNNLVQKDKIYHIAANFIIVLFLGVLFNPAVGLGAALIVSLVKEIYKEYKVDGSGWDWEDLFADIIGMILGLFIVL